MGASTFAHAVGFDASGVIPAEGGILKISIAAITWPQAVCATHAPER